MSVTTVITLYGVLGVVASVALIWFAVMLVTARLSVPMRDSLDRIRGRSAPSVIVVAWTVATTATVGSLYFSEIAHFQPCQLCWYQRIAMYPLVVVLGIAAWRRDIGVRVYAIPVAAIGAVIAAYHYLLEWFPALDTGACTVGIPCTQVWFREFGFVSLPYLALMAFLLIIALLLIPPRPGPGAKPA